MLVRACNCWATAALCSAQWDCKTSPHNADWGLALQCWRLDWLKAAAAANERWGWALGGHRYNVTCIIIGRITPINCCSCVDIQRWLTAERDEANTMTRRPWPGQYSLQTMTLANAALKLDVINIKHDVNTLCRFILANLKFAAFLLFTLLYLVSTDIQSAGAYSGFEVRGAWNVVWAVECRRHSYGGAEGADGVGSGEGAVPLPRKILACSPSKWCILMHSGARLGQL